MCAENNMTAAMPSTPANYFHLLRRQGMLEQRRPLIVFTPKSLLRLKAAVSPEREFTSGRWRPVIDDPEGPPDDRVRRIALCSGKIFYDLAKARAEDSTTALVRLEQLYPLPGAELGALLARYPAEAELVWVQEEPANMGAWPSLALHLPEQLGQRALRLVSRPESAAPATGSLVNHGAEQQRVVDSALE